jgi:hypothetical protein
VTGITVVGNDSMSAGQRVNSRMVKCGGNPCSR